MDETVEHHAGLLTLSHGVSVVGRLWLLGPGVFDMRVRFQIFALFAPVVFLGACGARDGFVGRKTGACTFGDYTQCVLADRPVGYWPLNEGPGEVAADVSGNGLNGWLAPGLTRQQPGLVSGAGNASMAFDNGGVLLPTTGGLAFSAETSLTVEMWLATTNLSTQMPFSQQRCTPDSVQLWLEGGSVGFRVATDAMFDVRAVGSTFTADGEPHHVVGVRDLETATVRTYVDGVLDAEMTDTNRSTGSLVNFPTDTWIGRRSDCGGENPFFGRIDEVAVYTKALSDERIAQHYEAGTRTAQDRDVLTP